MYAFKLPDLGEGIHEGEILKWYVQPGEIVEEDAPLVDVETDKAAVTIPSPVGGRVISVAAQVGEIVNVGQVIVSIEEDSAVAAATATVAGRTEASHPAASAVLPPVFAVLPITESQPGARNTPAALDPAPAARGASGLKRPVPAAPATRRLARELGVDLQLVTPTGPGGRVLPEDVRRISQQAQHVHLAAPVPPQRDGAVVQPLAQTPGLHEPPALAPHQVGALTEMATRAATAIPFFDLQPLPDFTQWGPVERETLRSIRRKVAHKMVTSMILVPHVAHMDEADVTLLEAFRRRERDKRTGKPGGHLTLLAFVVKAVTAGLRATPAFNASLDPFSEEIIYKKYYNIGIAADSGKGLIVPVIKETDRKSIIQIARDIEEVVDRVRAGTVDATDLRGGTFTITNIGPLGGTALIPAINYPEVAILGMGRVQEKPVVREGQIVIRQMLPLTLAFDHRIADGADAARFVSEMVRQLSDPNLLLLET